MGWSLRIARIHGTEVKVHLTFILFLSWIGIAHYLRGGPAFALEGLLFVVLIFLCVVLHELGHAYAASRFGIGTPDITLLPIGGVARLQRIPENPRQEFIIAIAGPLVNVVIAALLFLVLGRFGGLPAMQQIDNPAISMASKLATFNVLIVLFNLIPAFPMDGGRVLRSILASFMTYSRATQIAAGAGQVFAFLFAFIGLFFNPLLIFIGLFVYLAASQEAAIAQIREVSRGIPVSEAMITRFSSLPPDTTVREAAEALLRTGQHEFPIIDNKGMLHGILSRDRIIATMKEGEIERRVSEVMHPSVPSVSPDTSFFSAFRQMQENHCPALPIVDDEGSLVGLLTSENVGEMMMLGRVVSEHRAAPKQELRL